MRRMFWVLVTFSLWTMTVSAGSPIWDPPTLDLPDGVIQRSPTEFQLVSEGRPGRVLTVDSHGRDDVQIVATGEADPSIAREGFHFTSSGNMAVFLPNRAGTTYVRAFDPKRGEFLAGDPYSFKTRPEFVVGEHHIAALEQFGARRIPIGPGSVPLPGERLELIVLSRKDTTFSAAKVWADSQYTSVKAMDINAAGDVATVVAQDGAPGVTMFRCQLVVARNGRAATYPIGEDLNCPNAVAISPNGAAVAVAVQTKIRVYTAGQELARTAELSTDGCAINGMVFRLALSNDGRIGAWLIAFDEGKPPGHWRFVVRGRSGPCESIARYDFDSLREPRVQFIEGNHLYVTAQRLNAEPAVATVLDLN